MKEYYITEDCIIYNDMPRGWSHGNDQPLWHKSLLKRWKSMWTRCKNPEHPRYDSYKTCKIDERYRLFSNYVNDVIQLENFDKLCENPSKWDIDKDIKDKNNRHYFFEFLTITSSEDNSREVLDRCGHSFAVKNPPKPIIGINIKDNTIIIFKSLTDAQSKGFNKGNIGNCLKGRYKKSQGYIWLYLDINDRIKGGDV